MASKLVSIGYPWLADKQLRVVGRAALHGENGNIYRSDLFKKDFPHSDFLPDFLRDAIKTTSRGPRDDAGKL